MVAVSVSSWSVPLRARGQCQEGCRLYVGCCCFFLLRFLPGQCPCVRGVSARKGVGCMLAVAASSWSVPLRARGQYQEGCRLHVGSCGFFLVSALASAGPVPGRV